MSSQSNSNDVTHPLLVARQAAQIGAGAAIPGFIFGAAVGTIRTQTPVLFSLSSGAQWFALGSTFWAVRSSILQRDGLQNWWCTTRGHPLIPRQDLDPSPEDRVRASTIAGAVTGLGLGLVFRGPTNAAYGTVAFSLLGWAGQRGYLYLDQKNSEAVLKQRERVERGVTEDTLLQRFAKSKWSPMSILTDEEYEQLVGEKILAVEAEIALVDDKIAELRKLQKKVEATKQTPQSQSQQKQ